MEKVFLHRTAFWFSAVWGVVAATLPPIAKTIIEITSDSTLLPKLQVLYDTTVRQRFIFLFCPYAPPCSAGRICLQVVPTEYKGSASLRPLSVALACPA